MSPPPEFPRGGSVDLSGGQRIKRNCGMSVHKARAGSDPPVVFQRKRGLAIGAFRHQPTYDPLAATAAGAMIRFPHVIVNDVTP